MHPFHYVITNNQFLGGLSLHLNPVTWAYGAPCPAMVSPNAGLRRGQAIVPRSSPYMVHEKWIQARAETPTHGRCVGGWVVQWVNGWGQVILLNIK